MEKVTEIRLVHLADVHLGYTGNTSLIFREGERHEGRYVREVDIEQAVSRLSRSLVAASPPVDVLVVAGDLFHRSAPLPRAVQSAAKMVHLLVQSHIDVVVIDGNHETSSWRHTGSPTSYLRELGAHVINGATYEVLQGQDWSNPRLQGHLAVHALSYRAVLEHQFTGVSPLPGVLNVLLTHGRVQSMSDLNSLGLSAATIPPEVLRRGWDYVALGDWHIHRFNPLSDAPAYYAGSLEALNFGEATSYPPKADDQNAVRGAVDVRLAKGKQATLSTLPNTDRRPILRLASADASDLQPQSLMDILRERVSSLPVEALVRLDVTECPSEVWEQLDHAELERLRKQVRRCDIHWDIKYPDIGQSPDAISEVTIKSQWQDFVARNMQSDVDRNWYSEQGTARIGAAKEQLRGSHLQSGDE